MQVTENAHWRIARNFGWIAIFVLLAKGVGAAKEMVIAWRYGTSAVIDAYLFANNLVSWAPVVIGGIYGTVLNPLLARLSRSGSSSYRQFFSELAGLTIMVGSALSLLMLLAPLLSEILPSSLHDYGTYFIGALAPLPLVLVLSGLLSSVLLARERFASVLFDALPAVGLIISVLVFGGSTAPLVVGTLGGSAIGLMMLTIYAHSNGLLVGPTLGFRSSIWPDFWSGFGVMATGPVLMSLVTLIDPYMLANIGHGAIATLGYASRILALLMTLGATSIGRAILPVLSEAVSYGIQNRAKELAFRWAIIFFVIALVGCAVTAVFAPSVVRLLFERGAFTSEDTASVSFVLRLGLLQIPFYFSGLVLVQLLASDSRFGLIALGAAINLPVKIVANSVLGKMYGVGGIALASGCMYLFSLVFLVVSIRLYWRPQKIL